MTEPSEIGLTASGAKRVRAIAVIFYVIILATLLDPNAREKFVQVFGERPLHLPVLVFVAGLLTIVYLPIVPMLKHLFRLIAYAAADQSSMGQLGFAVYLLRVGRRHPELRRSQAIVTFGLLYYFAIAALWIVYCEKLGI